LERGEIVSSKDSLAKAGTQEIAPPIDRSPLTLLGTAIRQNCDEADNAIADIVKAVERQAPEIAQISKATDKGFRLVVDASDETLQAIDRGDIKLTTDKMGNTFAQMKRSDGRYGKKLPIKREEFSQGIDPVQAANAMQVKALQEQLNEIAEQITVIDGRVKEVLRGQQNDRIGLFRSGMSLYLEAREVSDEGLRKLLVAQSLRALSDATAQLDLELQEDVAYLANGEYRKAKGKRTELIDEKMASINRCFPVLHQASVARAAIYCEQGEVKAMASALEAYSRLIEQTVGSRAGLLAEFDASDDGTDHGVWRSRAALQLDVSALSKALSVPEKTFYLEAITDEKEAEDELG